MDSKALSTGPVAGQLPPNLETPFTGYASLNRNPAAEDRALLNHK